MKDDNSLKTSLFVLFILLYTIIVLITIVLLATKPVQTSDSLENNGWNPDFVDHQIERIKYEAQHDR